MEKTQENTDKLMSDIVKEEYSIQDLLEDQNLENRQNEITEITIQISFRCFVCGIGYGDAQSLFLHLASHGTPGNENSNSTPILTCEEDSGCQVEETLNCQLPPESGESEKNKTKASVPRSNHFDCEICGEKIGFEKTLRRHLWRVHDLRNIFKCDKCPLIFRNGSSLQKHKDTKHSGNSLPCQNCDKTVSRSIILEEYKRVHLGDQAFECQICGTKLKNKNNFSRHMKVIHSWTESYRCKECPKVFKSKSDLIRHSGMHPVRPNVDKFNCETCGAKFQYQIGLLDHLKEDHHSKDQPKSSQSLKTYSRSSKCVVPEKDVEKESPQPPQPDCSLPSQISEEKDPPEKESQAPVPPFVCKTCGAKFNSDSGFKWHLETHARKLFACIICNKTFQEYNNLAAHEKTHFFGDECELPMNGESTKNDQARKSPETSRRSSTQEEVPIIDLDSSDNSEVDEKTTIDDFPDKEKEREEPSHVSDLAVEKDMHPDELEPPEISPIELTRLKNSDPVLQDFECEKCGLILQTKQGMRRHILHTHYGKKCHIRLLSQLDPFICPHCDSVFWERYMFEAHQSKHTTSKQSNGILASKVRKKTSGSSLLLRKRIRTRIAGQTHSDKLYTCKICKKSFRASYHLKEHEKNHLGVHGVNGAKCDVCGAKLMHKKSLSRHLRDVHGKRTSFKCKNCPKFFKTSSDLVKHEETHSVTCQKCGKSFKLPEYLRRHEKVHETTCEICGTKLKQKKSLIRHLRNVHGKSSNTPQVPSTPFQCKICPKTFESSLDLEKHKESHPRKLYACQICGKTFEQYKDLRKHRKGHVARHKIKCEICGVKLQYRSSMIRHVKNVHARKNNYKCNHCPLTFRSSSGLRRHKDNKHPSKLFTCQKCGKSFKLPEYLRRHEKLHETKCEICGTKLKRKESLRRHLREIHGKTSNTSVLPEPTNPFQCKICPKTFTTSSDLEKHKESHPRKLYACQICGKTFGENKYLRQHRRSHFPRVTRHKPECEFCGKIIKYEYNMRRHLKIIHSRTYICKCEQCPMKFRSVLELQRHKDLRHSNRCEETTTTPTIKKEEDERIPMDDQGFKCEICESTLKYEKGLTRHMKEVHGKDSKTSSFKCNKCPRNFKSYSDLEKHKDTHQDRNSKIKKTVKRLERPKVTHSTEAIECEKCGWKVKTKRGIKRHILSVHYGKKCHIRLLSQLEPFICPHCDSVFWEKSALKTHLYYRHRNSNKMDNKAKSSQTVIEISDDED